ncbi:MAG: ABC transporter ATP-binding protein [Hyphomicrobiaceae bacterium]
MSTHPSEETLLTVRDLSVDFRSARTVTRAVDHVSFTIQKGETVALVGESGSGKSVSALSITRLLPYPAAFHPSGEIFFEGRDLLKIREGQMREVRGNRISIIFQEPMTSLNPLQTIERQVGEVLREHRGMLPNAAKARTLELLHLVGIRNPEERLDAYPHQLSGGQRQRVMIAAALVLDPVLLIADEPTTALDVTTQAQILKLIAELQERHGTGVLFITHDFGVVAEIAHRVVVMQGGRVVEAGTRDEILFAPREEYTKMLMASVPSLEPPKRTPKTSQVALSTEHLSKTYRSAGFLFGGGRTVKAADDVTIEVRRGETLGIVGESGSGKTTVARCIARLIEPTAGAVRIGDLDIAHLPERQLRPHRKAVQIVFQDPNRSLNPRRTVGASITEGPVNFGEKRESALERAGTLMQLVGLSPDALDRYPHQFSGGQRQRIAIARALAMEPTILIADEAVSALDVSVQAQVLRLLDDVRKRFDLAVLFITHDLRVAAQICDRIAVMQNGIVVETGATGEIFSDPQHPYTHALFAAAPGRGVRFGEALGAEQA